MPYPICSRSCSWSDWRQAVCSSRPLHAAALAVLAGLIGALALAACQPLPRPFQPEEKPAETAKLIEPGAASGVFVRPVATNAPAAGETLSRAVAHALQAQGIPASLESLNRGSFILFGAASAVPGAEPGQLDLLLRWELMDPWDRLADRFEERRRLSAHDWTAGSAEALAPAAQAIAERIAHLLGEAPPAGTAERPTLLLLPIEGAPGDGALSLARALASSLGEAGLALAQTTGPRTLLVEGRVSVTETGPDTARVDVVWTVLASDGRELGTVRQGGQVARKTVEGAWGALARLVAENGAQGIADLIRKLPAGS